MEPDPNIPEEEPDPILDNLDRLEQCMEQLQPGDLAFVKALIEAGRQYAPLREQFGMDDGQIRATKQRILRNLRRCFGIG